MVEFVKLAFVRRRINASPLMSWKESILSTAQTILASDAKLNPNKSNSPDMVIQQRYIKDLRRSKTNRSYWVNLDVRSGYSHHTVTHRVDTTASPTAPVAWASSCPASTLGNAERRGTKTPEVDDDDVVNPNEPNVWEDGAELYRT